MTIQHINNSNSSLIKDKNNTEKTGFVNKCLGDKLKVCKSLKRSIEE